MCTLSFIAKHNGFLVGMNRDELLSRGVAQPPILRKVPGTTALFPTDVEGGSWIAVTETGNCFAVLNRNGGDRRKKQRSRGELVIKVLGSAGFPDAEALLGGSELARYLPFRLVALFSSAEQVFEWVWDSRRLTSIEHGWQSRHWFSSGISDEEATRTRSRVFDSAWDESDAGERDWLRRVHRSHGEIAGAFSVCVHRDDAGSVSYTEVSVNHSEIAMSYGPGSPCQSAPMSEIVIRRPLTVSIL